MESHAPIEKHYAFYTIALAIAVVVSVMLNAWQFLEPEGRVSCASFGSYMDIVAAYHDGASWLDKDGDGIPCESRLP